MRAAAVVLGGCALALTAVLSGCSSSPEKQALSPTEEAASAVAASELAWTQYVDGDTLPTVTIATLEDMLSAVSESEKSLTTLPASETAASASALAAVRSSADAIGRALGKVKDGVPGDGPTGPSLDAAGKRLDAAVKALGGDR